MTQYPSWAGRPEHTHCEANGCHATVPGESSELPDGTVARTAVPGTGLCRTHHERFGRVVNDMVGLWSQLEGALYRRSSGATNQKVQTSGVTDLSASWNPHASEVMADVREWAAFLVRTVLRDCPPPPPDVRKWMRPVSVRDEHTGQRITQPSFYEHVQTIEHNHTITRMTPTPVALAALARHYGRWLSYYPGIVPLGPALLADALRLRAQAIAAVQADPVRRIAADLECAQQVADEQLELLRCGARMVVILDGNGLPGLMVCSEHPKTHHQYPQDEWMGWSSDPRP